MSKLICTKDFKDIFPIKIALLAISYKKKYYHLTLAENVLSALSLICAIFELHGQDTITFNDVCDYFYMSKNDRRLIKDYAFKKASHKSLTK